MADIRFYHLIQKTIEEALPELLDKTLQQGSRAVVMAGSKERVEDFARLLWVYKQDAFLPHGTAQDGNAADQPIWITATEERPNDADILFLTDSASVADLSLYKRICVLFDGNDDTALTNARALWKRMKGEDHVMSYWQQGPKGWVKQDY